ncbi:hypothetical protein MPTK1_1g11900 [Marchantia polymorpha subsp. ruderalis]|uniref:Uncharacterized protein n=2 Tax=Marchantia polymorpha TaxID=3197 RepID=A0AAF6AP63_MARPO|nr:hypothetical protein MARPO_0014s0038 [Marchantia polymorpha]BBM98233.1 hypothetical protein Mp_1g11900 [Marchantia polymorpha subsp. ruderalis]|eukprot:PTQ45488.1 hypothetical protein MARPO_0014s0038 [Marchantia polymorpha]
MAILYMGQAKVGSGRGRGERLTFGIEKGGVGTGGRGASLVLMCMSGANIYEERASVSCRWENSRSRWPGETGGTERHRRRDIAGWRGDTWQGRGPSRLHSKL